MPEPSDEFKERFNIGNYNSTIDMQFRMFISRVYARSLPLGEEQYNQLRDAFFGGVHTAYRCEEDFSGELITYIDGKIKQLRLERKET